VIELIYSDPESSSGNAQRNYALDFIKDEDCYVYFLDDDNSIHNDLYKLIANLEDNKMYTFGQKRNESVFPYIDILRGDKVNIYRIDTGMLLIDNGLIGNIRWKIDKYSADGYFIKECFLKNHDKWIYVDEVLSYYNHVPLNQNE
jgi:hypothetical protein